MWPIAKKFLHPREFLQTFVCVPNGIWNKEHTHVHLCFVIKAAHASHKFKEKTALSHQIKSDFFCIKTAKAFVKIYC